MKTALSGILLLDASFRHAVDPFGTAVTAKEHPQTDVPMEIAMLKGDAPHTYVVTLRVSIESPTSLYAVSVAYAVLLTIDPEGAELPPDFDSQVTLAGASMAFPYCREVISNLTSRGRFGAVWVNPVNFREIFKQQNAEKPVATE